MQSHYDLTYGDHPLDIHTHGPQRNHPCGIWVKLSTFANVVQSGNKSYNQMLLCREACLTGQPLKKSSIYMWNQSHVGHINLSSCCPPPNAPYEGSYLVILCMVTFLHTSKWPMARHVNKIRHTKRICVAMRLEYVLRIYTP